MLALIFNVAAWAIVLVMGAVVIAGLIALWRTMWPLAAVLTSLVLATFIWMWDRVRHERDLGSDVRRDMGEPPRGPEDARRRWW